MDAADIPALVRRLRSGGNRLGQLQAAKQLLDALMWTTTSGRRIPGAPQQAAFAAAGGVEAAVQLMQTGAPALQFAAVDLLTEACFENEQCAEAVLAAGGISLMLSMLRPGSLAAGEQLGTDHNRVARALAYAVGAIRAAAQAAAEAGAIEVLAPLLHDRLQQPSRLWSSVAVALIALAKLGEQHAAGIAALGAIEALVQRLSACEVNGLFVPITTAALGALADGSAQRTAAIVRAGAVPALVRCLSSQCLDTQNNAAALLHAVLPVCPQERPAVIAAGGDSQLQKLLGSSRSDVCQHAAYALASLAAAGQQEATAAQPAAVAIHVPEQPARPSRICAAPGFGATSGLRRCGGCGAACAAAVAAAQCATAAPSAAVCTGGSIRRSADACRRSGGPLRQGRQQQAPETARCTILAVAAALIASSTHAVSLSCYHVKSAGNACECGLGSCGMRLRCGPAACRSAARHIRLRTFKSARLNTPLLAHRPPQFALGSACIKRAACAGNKAVAC